MNSEAYDSIMRILDKIGGVSKDSLEQAPLSPFVEVLVSEL